MDVAEAVGLAVRRVRVRRGHTQEELAFLAGVDRTYVSGLERGIRNPALSTLQRVASALNIRLSRLLAIAEQIQDGPPRPVHARGR